MEGTGLLVDVQRLEDSEQHHGADDADYPDAPRAHRHDPERSGQPEPEHGADDPDDDIGDDAHLGARLHDEAGQPSDHSPDNQGHDEAHSPSLRRPGRSNEELAANLSSIRPVAGPARASARSAPSLWPPGTWRTPFASFPAQHGSIRIWPKTASKPWTRKVFAAANLDALPRFWMGALPSDGWRPP